MQIKTTLRYHYLPIQMAKIQNTKKLNADEDVKSKMNSK